MSSIRKAFEIKKRPSGGNDVYCTICKKTSRAWDYRRNALMVGYAHVLHEHTPEWLHKAAFNE